MIFNVKYKTELPLEPKSPIAYFISDDDTELVVEFIDSDTNEIVNKQTVKSGEIAYGSRQWYTNWKVIFKTLKGQILHTDYFDPTNKVIFIKIDGYALGDNLAWIPYVEEFRVKHNCTVICSTFWNYLFEGVYKDILFVEPNTTIHNIYAQYYIGAHTNDGIYSPSDVSKEPLQKIATDILGLEWYESRPYIGEKYYRMKPKIEGRYVCLSEHASGPEKYWREPGGWQKVVDYLNTQGVKVAVISKEPTTLKNVLDLTGDFPIEERMLDIFHAECYLGVSSGLAWLAYALNTKVIMVSDGTPIWHEFSENCIRLSENNLEKIDYIYSKVTSYKKVIKSLVGSGVS